MTSATLPAPRLGTLHAFFGSELLFAATGSLIVLLLLVTGPAMFLDARQFQGESVWTKPIKFQAALSIYLLCLAFFARWLPAGMTGGRLNGVYVGRAYVGAVVFAIIAEFLWIGGAAMFGVASHFNQSEPIMIRLYTVMGPLAVVVTSASLVLGIAKWRNAGVALPMALHLSVALGLVLTFALTVLVASIMSSMPGHGVGIMPGCETLPLFGWSREGGDLRAAHFFATHALHMLPFIGLVLTKFSSDRIARAGVWTSAAVFITLVILTLVQALMGRPFCSLTAKQRY